MAATAETTTYVDPELMAAVEDVYQTAPPLVEVVPAMAEDRYTRQRAASFIGACLTDKTVEFAAANVRPIESLYDALGLAAEGNAEARQLITTNVATDVIERTIKSGHVMEVDLAVDEAGNIAQFGQTMESVQANSLRLAANSWQMRQRTEAEATNAFRINDLHQAGKLQDYSLVVFSRAADNMSETEMTDAGFFSDTMSCAIQVTSASGNRLKTESAFVAGAAAPGARRHDGETVAALGARLGADFSGKSAAEIINTPLLVHHSLLPDGVINLVQMYDDCAGGTFFGEAKPRQDYQLYRQQCVQRQIMLQPKVELITRELINEAPIIKNRLQATQRLHKLSEKHMVQQAVFDKTINPAVFGPAETHILAARLHWEQGDYEQALNHTAQAVTTARSSSCPGGSKQAEAAREGDNGLTTETDDDSKDCSFVSKQCPECKSKNVLTNVKRISKSQKRISGSCGCVKYVRG